MCNGIIYVNYVALAIDPFLGLQMSPSINSSNMKRTWNWGKNAKQDSTSVVPCVLCFYQTIKMIPWSIRTFWDNGSAGNKQKMQVRHKGYISQK